MYVHQKSGFSLIEMAIVIVIVGLMSGSLIIWKNLKQAAEANNIIKEIEQIKIAYNTFQQKYDGIPGDFAGATELWGQKAGCGTGNSSFNQATCDGNGDGSIETVDSDENWCTWQHLANAELFGNIKQFSCGLYSSPPVNKAAPKITSGPNKWPHYRMRYTNIKMSATDKEDYHGMSGNNILEVLPPAFMTPALVPSIMHKIDTKSDDGRPFTGNIQTADYLNMSPAYHPRFGPCTANNPNPDSAEYDIHSDMISCTLGSILEKR